MYLEYKLGSREVNCNPAVPILNAVHNLGCTVDGHGGHVYHMRAIMYSLMKLGVHTRVKRWNITQNEWWWGGVKPGNMNENNTRR